MTTLRMASRHWDHLTPLALGDVPTPGIELAIDRRDETPNLWACAELDVAETSFSQYVLRRAAGDRSVTALPVFVMSGFRQRCIITRKDSPLVDLSMLAGTTVGLTGWPDSGNTWTRALVRRAGVVMDQVQWRVGPLTAAHPVVDRIGPSGAPASVRHTDGGGTLTGQLLDGVLDAVMTPFMPPGFYVAGSPYRTLIPDTRGAEAAYYRAVGYLPGIHLIAVKTRVLDSDPSIAQRVLDALDAAKRLAAARRGKLQDVLPWLNEEIAATAAVFGPDWLPYGSSATAAMITDFVAEHRAQGTLRSDIDIAEIFPLTLEPAQ